MAGKHPAIFFHPNNVKSAIITPASLIFNRRCLPYRISPTTNSLFNPFPRIRQIQTEL